MKKPKLKTMITIIALLLAVSLAFLRWNDKQDYNKKSNALHRKLRLREAQADSIRGVCSELVLKLNSQRSQLQALKEMLQEKDVEILTVKKKLSEVSNVDFTLLSDSAVVDILSKIEFDSEDL